MQGNSLLRRPTLLAKGHVLSSPDRILKSAGPDRILKSAGAALIASFSLATGAVAQVTSPSPGCTAANNGDYDFIVLDTMSGTTMAPFSGDFTEGEILTFEFMSDFEAGVLVEDTTDSVEIINQPDPPPTDYEIPASGNRNFNMQTETEASNVNATVRCMQAEGSITINKTSDVDGDYAFTGDLGAFMISIVGGDGASQSFNNIATGSYVVMETASEATNLAAIMCTGDDDNGSVIDVEGGQVTIDLDAGEVIQCTFTNNDAGPTEEEIALHSSHAIRNFLYRRANALLSEEPDRPRIIRKKPGVLWDGGINELNVSANGNGMNADFGASTGGIWGNKFDVWVEGHYRSQNYDNGAAFDSDFGVVYFGADYLVSEDLLVGALGQLDWMSDESPALGENISGNGWMVGPYISARVDRNLFFDARAAWGRSNNDLEITGFGVDDEFDTSRWLVRGALTGNHQMGDWRITPTASVAYFEEHQKSYMSNTGAFIDSQTVALGRAAIAPELAWRHVTEGGTLIEPQFTLSGVWDFETPSGLSIPGWTVTTDKFRLSLEAALMVAFRNGFAVRAAGTYDGIAASGYEAYGARLWIDVPIGGPAPPAPPAGPQMKECADGVMIPVMDDCPNAAPGNVSSGFAFAAGKSGLSDDAYAPLEDAWAQASAYDIKAILIEVGGDAGGATADDRTLAMHRAEAIKAALEAMGAPRDIIIIVTPPGPYPDGAAKVTFELL